MFSIFLIYRTYDLVQSLIKSNPADYNFGEIGIIAFLLALFITGIFAFLGFAYPTNILLPARYYDIKSPILLDRMYSIFGIKYFKFALLFFFWGSKKNRKKYFNGTKAGIRNFIYQTKQSEFGHLISFVIILLITLLLLFYGYTLLFVLTNVINVIGNLYPIILQRKHRSRISKLKL